MESLFLGLPRETWVMIIIIWVIVTLNVILLKCKIKKEPIMEKSNNGGVNDDGRQ
jgi:hypothetical protein